MNRVLIFVFVMLVAKPALAYIGPGLGVAAVWMLFGPIAAVVSVIALISYFPLRYYYKKYKHKKMQEEASDDDGDQDKPPSVE